MSVRCAALLRGINVGKAKRVPMAGLRTVVESLGFTEVGTLLNSGNVTFTAAKGELSDAAQRLEVAIADAFGFEVPVVVVTAPEMDDIIAGNPYAGAASEPSRLLVAFVSDRNALSRLDQLASGNFGSSRLAAGSHAAYIWCPDGISESPLPDEAVRVLKGAVVTTRNWTTTLKLQERLRA